MKRNNRLGTAIRIILGIFAAAALILGGIAFRDIRHYINRVPDITPYENLTFPQGSELFPHDLAEITVADKSTAVTARIVSAQWADGTGDELAISGNGASLKIGAKTGELCIWVQATGIEAREAECIIQIKE